MQLVSAAAVPASPERLHQAFLASLSPRTRRAYTEDLAAFAAHLQLGTGPAQAAGYLLSCAAGTANEIALDWRSAMLGAGLSPATVNRRLSALRSLVRLARTLGLVAWSLEVPNLRVQSYRDTRGPGAGVVRQLLAAAARDDSPKGRRDHAILRLLHDCALRRAEVVGLDLEHWDGEGLWIAGKGRQGQRERVTVPLQTRAALERWLAVRGREAGPLFLTTPPHGGPGGRMDGSDVFRLVRRAGERVGARVRPHGLRHAAVTRALDLTGGDVRTVQRFSRHRDLRTLQVYDDARRDDAGAVAALVAASAG